MDEDECGADDVTDFAGAGGEVPQDSPAAGEQSEAAFAQAAKGTQQHVVGAGVDVEDLAAGGLFDRGEHADTGAFVAGVGERGQPLGGGLVQGGEYVCAGGGQVVY